MKSFIMIDKDMQNSCVFQNEKNWWMWCKLKFLENFRNGEIRIGKSKDKIQFKKGEIVMLFGELCRELKTTHKTLHLFLKMLQDEGLIFVNVLPKYTVISFKKNDEISTKKVDENDTNFEVLETKNTSDFNEKNDDFSVKNMPENDTNFDVLETNSKEKRKEAKEKRKEINKEKKNLSHTHARARERELKFFEDLKDSEDFFTQSAALMNSDPDELKILLEWFNEQNLLIDKSHEDFADFKSHFLHWAKIEIQKAARQKLINNNATEQKYAANRRQERRGSDVGNHTADDFGGSF